VIRTVYILGGSMIRKRTLTAALAVLALVPFANLAEAAPVLVTSRSALGGTDFLDWGILGPTGTLVPNAFTITSSGGVEVEISKASAGDFQRREQAFSWTGNFEPGAPILYTNRTPGPISIDFGGLVFGGGAQIQWVQFGSFTATIEAFDAADRSLGMFTLTGSSTPANDNSALFIGILDTAQSIARIEIGLTTDGAFAINRFDFVGTPHRPTQISGPGTPALIGTGLVGVAALRRRKRA